MFVWQRSFGVDRNRKSGKLFFNSESSYLCMSLRRWADCQLQTLGTSFPRLFSGLCFSISFGSVLVTLLSLLFESRSCFLTQNHLNKSWMNEWTKVEWMNEWIVYCHITVLLQFENINTYIRLLELVFFVCSILRQKDIIGQCCLQPYPVEYRHTKKIPTHRKLHNTHRSS